MILFAVVALFGLVVQCIKVGMNEFWETQSVVAWSFWG